MSILITTQKLIPIKKKKGVAAGILKHLKANPYVSDEESLQNSLEKRREALMTPSTKPQRN